MSDGPKCPTFREPIVVSRVFVTFLHPVLCRNAIAAVTIKPLWQYQNVHVIRVEYG